MAKRKSLSEIVAYNIQSRRILTGKSQEALAIKAGLSTSYVSMLERGIRTPSLEVIEALGKALRVDPVKLLEGA